ncbi:MAG: hypothetical protein IJZ26_00025, partial [Clostridia bacterium]|nr:hypothetical protein [Clostridia bacterium]
WTELGNIKGGQGEPGEPGTPAVAPTVEINADGYWCVDGESTGVKAKGDNGQPGHSPEVTIVDGYWYIDGETTGVKAEGKDGATWLSGEGAPTTQGKSGDFYLDETTYDIYKNTAGTWAKIGNVKGNPGSAGQSNYVWIKYADNMPDNNDDMIDVVNNYIGVYNGTSATAPTDYTLYTWYNIKGETGDTPQLTIDNDGFIVIDGVKTNVCLYEKEVEKEISYNSNTINNYNYSLVQGNALGNMQTTRICLSINYKFKAGTTFKFVGNDVDYQWGCVWSEDIEIDTNTFCDSGWINSSTQSGEFATESTIGNGYSVSYNAENKTATLLKDGYLRINFAKSSTSSTINTTDQDFANYIEINGIYYGLTEKLNIDVEEQQTTVVDYFVNSVAHRGYSTDAPENTLSAYRLAKEKGFNTVECDVSFTSDGVGVLLHDSTIDRTSNGTGNIADMTLEQVRQYDFGSWQSSEYAGEQIPTFEEFIKLCKNLSLHPYIEIKDGATQTEVESLVTMVARYGMIDDVTWISFQSDALTYIKNKDNTARLGYLVSTITESTITTAKSLKTEQNEVFIDAKNENLTEQAINLCIAELIPLEVWTVNDIDTILSLDPYISGVTSDDKVAGKILYENNKK